jgi:hypothetical protein
MANEPRYIVRDYTTKYPADYEGDIWHEDVVRPSNHKWQKRDDSEANDFNLKSEARCPTYGSCEFCFRSGPVGKLCIDCGDDKFEGKYKVALYQNCVIDSVTLAEVLEKGHETVRADSTFEWIQTPQMGLSVDQIQINIGHKRNQEETRMIMGKVYNMLP